MKRLLLLLVVACGPKAVPDSFIFGAAVAGFQVDPGCPTVPADQCEDRNSDWYQWVTSPAPLSDLASDLTFEPVSDGPGEWELYDHDFALAKNELGVGAVRMSLEWSRIFPTATDGLFGDPLRAVANQDALDHYHSIFAALKAHRLKPLVTLNHDTLPLWLHDGVACHADLANCVNRGWLDHDRIVTEIAKYAAFCAQEFGAEVDWWATLNDPFSVVLHGYLSPSAQRVNPPGVKLKAEEAKAAMFAMVDANAAMYDAVKANDTLDADRDGTAASVGLVYSAVPTLPADPANPVDVRAAANAAYLFNTVFLDAVIKGLVDADLDGTADNTLPKPALLGRIDYLGVNYFTRVSVTGTGDPVVPSFSALTTFDPSSLVQTTGDAKGLYDITLQLQARYKMPMFITATGADAARDPSAAAQWVVGTMTWAKRALRDGADIRGYFAWSLIDTYEWNQGTTAKFGLYAVDLATKARTARESASAYREIVKARDVPSTWLTKYPAPER